MSDSHFYSQNPTSRRDILRFGFTGFTSLSLAQMLRMRTLSAAAPTAASQASSTASNSTAPRTSVILVWLRGGCSHLDTFDPKPAAGSEFRGPFSLISTRTPGLFVTELLPRLASISHRYSVLRSIAHTGGGHPAGSLQVLAGDSDPQDKTKPIYPDFMSIANFLRSDRKKPLPNYVGVRPITNYDSFTIAGPTYLGPAYEPFKVYGDPSSPSFKVPNIGLSDAGEVQRLNSRVSLRRNLDRFRADLDHYGSMKAVDDFERQAVNLLTSTETARAFDLAQEDRATRERYGMNAWGQQCLLSRRLVEAGVEIVTTELTGPLCGRVQNWDDHAVNQHVFDALKFRVPTVDQAVSALIEDIYARGLDRRVLVVVAGEFGRTPRISHVASSGGGVASAPAGTVQPGRDHWPSANSMLFAGGNIPVGQIIGSTDRRGERAKDRPTTTGDFLATIYHHLGIDYERVSIPNFAGRPIPILNEGRPIPELTSQGG